MEWHNRIHIPTQEKEEEEFFLTLFKLVYSYKESMQYYN